MEFFRDINTNLEDLRYFLPKNPERKIPKKSRDFFWIWVLDIYQKSPPDLKSLAFGFFVG